MIVCITAGDEDFSEELKDCSVGMDTVSTREPERYLCHSL